MALEQEVKLPYSTVEAARQAVLAAGGRLIVSRRLLADVFYDTADARLVQRSQALRLRYDGPNVTLTWKGAPQPGAVKTREEIETACVDGGNLAALLGALGYVPRFRSEKHREEYRLDGVLVTVDEVPFGVFVEIEADPGAIDAVTRRLGRSPEDYELASYVSLWRRWCAAQGLPFGDMLFRRIPGSPRS